MNTKEFDDLIALQAGTIIACPDSCLFVRVNDPEDRVHFASLIDGAMFHVSWIPLPYSSFKIGVPA